MTTSPIAVVRRTRPGGVTVECPHCGGLHHHGLPPGDATVGHRAAHCTPGASYTVPDHTHGVTA